MPIITRKIYDPKHLRYVGGCHGGNNHSIDIIFSCIKFHWMKIYFRFYFIKIFPRITVFPLHLLLQKSNSFSCVTIICYKSDPLCDDAHISNMPLNIKTRSKKQHLFSGHIIIIIQETETCLAWHENIKTKYRKWM